MSPLHLVYFSSVSGNTAHFVEKLGVEEGFAHRLPLKTRDDTLIMNEPFILLTPSYGGGEVKGAVPKQVIKFLNVPQNRELIQGVISSGNMNFYDGYGLAGRIISAKCHVPVLYTFELRGTDTDVAVVRSFLE